MMKLLALSQCVPNCTFELDQIPCLNSLSFTRTAAPGSHGVISQQQLTPPVTPRSQATFTRWIWWQETLSATLSYLILQFINFTFFFFFNYYFVSQQREEYEYVFTYQRKLEISQIFLLSFLSCHRLRAVAVSNSGFENIVPVLKPKAVSHAVILARISIGGTIQQKWVETSRNICFLGKA